MAASEVGGFGMSVPAGVTQDAHIGGAHGWVECALSLWPAADDNFTSACPRDARPDGSYLYYSREVPHRVCPACRPLVGGWGWDQACYVRRPPPLHLPSHNKRPVR